MYAWKFDQFPRGVNLKAIPTLPPEELTSAEAEERFARLGTELFELQDLLFGARQNSVLMVLQGRDTAGKDGTVKHVVGCLNPRGVRVETFGVPTQEEREHDFLWRIHRHAPRLGEVAIFNRSHYEDVLVVRVHDLVPRKLWEARYDAINAFEESLAQQGTIILKFFLHITREEQERRLRDREVDPAKAWKLNVNDWKERDFWADYTEAYEAAIARCSTPHAPWFVVPSDKKWFRNLAVAEALYDTLRTYRHAWREQLEKTGAAKVTEWEAYRAALPNRKAQRTRRR